jgi:hypothetical protein
MTSTEKLSADNRVFMIVREIIFRFGRWDRLADGRFRTRRLEAYATYLSNDPSQPVEKVDQHLANRDQDGLSPAPVYDQNLDKCQETARSGEFWQVP